MRQAIAIAVVATGLAIASSACAQSFSRPGPLWRERGRPANGWMPRPFPYGGFVCPYCFFPPVYLSVGWFNTAGGTVSTFGPGYGEPAESSPPQPRHEAVAIQLATAVQRLSDQVQDLRQQQAPPAISRPQASARPAPPEKLLPTILIFRDGSRVTVENYAILGGSLWIFQGEATRKIPLNKIDLQATQKANASDGVTFVAPGLS